MLNNDVRQSWQTNALNNKHALKFKTFKLRRHKLQTSERLEDVNN